MVFLLLEERPRRRERASRGLHIWRHCVGIGWRAMVGVDVSKGGAEVHPKCAGSLNARDGVYLEHRALLKYITASSRANPQPWAAIASRSIIAQLSNRADPGRRVCGGWSLMFGFGDRR